MLPDTTANTEGDTPSYVPVPEFFAERSVFVTGATGFLGKVLVEKLLRSCPKVKVIYLLMRPKRGRDLEARLADIVDSPLFDRLRKENPPQLQKIVPVYGDISQPILGLSQADRQTLIRSVSVVFHCAATVNFTEPLRVAVEVNIRGTRRVVELCRMMAGLAALVHVSTCYANCDLDEIEEVVYSPPCDPDHIVQCAEWMDDELWAHMETKLIGKKPNTYTFTKALTESLLLKEGNGLPISIVRPSIVAASLREPTVAWVDSTNGATGTVAGFGLGVVRFLHAYEEKVIDLIPVDMVVNLIICSSWRSGTRGSTGIDVYSSCTAMKRQPLTYGGICDILNKAISIYPFEEYMGFLPNIRAIQHGRIVWSLRICLQVLPAYVQDAVLKLLGKKPFTVRTVKKAITAHDNMAYFTTRQWRFRDDNTKRLMTCLSKGDKEVFYYDVEEIHWPTYLANYEWGVRKYLLKQDPKTLPQSRRRMTRLRWTYNAICLCLMLQPVLIPILLYSRHKK